MSEQLSRVVMVESIADWDAILKQATAQESPVVAHFSAEWCAPCKFMSKTFHDMSRKCRKLVFLHIDVDELKDIGDKMNVRAMPTFLFIKQEQVVDKLVGANKDELIKKIARLNES